MVFVVDTDKNMSFKGHDNFGKNFMYVAMESVKIFDDKDECVRFTPCIINYVVENTILTKEEVLTKFVPLQSHHIGIDGESLGSPKNIAKYKMK